METSQLSAVKGARAGLERDPSLPGDGEMGAATQIARNRGYGASEYTHTARTSATHLVSARLSLG